VRITVLCVGKLKDAWIRDGCDEYARRLRGKLALNTVEVKDDAALLRAVPARGRVWALDEHGAELSSAELAERLKRYMDAAEPGLTFAIGGADGLPAQLLERAHLRWSLGRLTLPHRLARLILIEQLYRAVSILRGEPYHRP
jgi:23S rRNA (pseudouridine1915-N3)-methyltransferase